jgi:DOPA 4,5-dioxygenase
MNDAPFHAHTYYDPEQRGAADALRTRLLALKDAGAILYVGQLRDGKVGPHPISQFEVHFFENAEPLVRAEIAASGLRALIHPLTDDDLADHTTLGRWIGEPIELDLSVLDPPGVNQGVARFGKTDF